MLAEQYRFMKIEDLPPYENNAMLHTARQIEQLADLIDTVGWTNVVVADKKGIIAGHKRVMAARLIYGRGGRIFLPGSIPNGMPIPIGTVPVLWGNNWSEAQRTAYIIQDNQYGRVAEMNDEILQMEFDNLELEYFDLSTLGFDSSEIDRITSLGIDNGDEEEEDNEDPAGNSHNTPLAIVLSPQELAQWRKIKEKHGVSTDKACFLKLIENQEES
jgi:hypothetical protein